MHVFRFAGLVLVACAAGCGKVSYTATSVSTNGAQSAPIILKVDARPDAQITQAGDLTIGGKSVSVSPDQRNALEDYFLTARLMRGPDTGAAVAHAASSPVRPAASTLCNDLASKKVSQERDVGAKIPVLQPYLHTTDDDISRCVENWR